MERARGSQYTYVGLKTLMIKYLLLGSVIVGALVWTCAMAQAHDHEHPGSSCKGFEHCTAEQIDALCGEPVEPCGVVTTTTTTTTVSTSTTSTTVGPLAEGFSCRTYNPTRTGGFNCRVVYGTRVAHCLRVIPRQNGPWIGRRCSIPISATVRVGGY